MKSARVLIGWLALAAAVVAQPVAPSPDLEEVMEMIESGRPGEAERSLRALLGERESAVARGLLGAALGQQGRLDEAEDELLRAIQLDPRLLTARQHLGRIYLQRQEVERALAILREAAALGPLDRDLSLHLAKAELAAGNWAAAERLLRSCIERFDSVQARLELARLDARRGAQAESLRTLRQALELAPNSEELLSAFARLSLAAREPVPAIRALEALTRMHPSVADHAHLLGVARLQIAENESAVEVLQRALELERDRVTTMTALGLAYNNQKSFERAAAVLGRALEIQPGNVETLAALAEAEEGLGELESAEAHALRVLAQNADHLVAHLVIGKVRMSQRRYAEAVDALSRAVAVDPTSAKAHYQLSLAYARLGDRERSQRHLDLYRDALRQAEEYLIELRTQAGLGVSGMKR